MTNGESLVRDELTRYGQRWLEVARMGGPVQRGPWLGRVPVESLYLAKAWERVEPGLGVHRLHIWWPAREMVQVMGPDGKGIPATLWYIERGQTIRNAAGNAAAAFWLALECWPERVLVQKLPAGAPGEMALFFDRSVKLSIGERADLPKGFVLVF